MFDVGPDAAQGDVLSERLGTLSTGDAHLFPEDKLLDEDLLDNRIHEGVALASDLGNCVNDTADGDALDLDVGPRERFTDMLKVLLDMCRQADRASAYRPFTDGQFFMGERDRSALGDLVI